MVSSGKRLNGLGSGMITLLLIYSFFATAGIAAYNFMMFPLVIILVFFGFDDESREDQDEDEEENPDSPEE